MPAILDRPSDKAAKKHAGQWIAIRDGKILHSAFTPNEVANWLREKNERADVVYRVPAEGEPTACYY